MSHKNHRLLEEVGLEAFGLGQAPTVDVIGDTSSSINAADADRAYAVITLHSVTTGDVFFAVGHPAEAAKGQKFQLGVPVRVWGRQDVNAICGTAAATALVIQQSFNRGLPRQGDAA